MAMEPLFGFYKHDTLANAKKRLPTSEPVRTPADHGRRAGCAVAVRGRDLGAFLAKPALVNHREGWAAIGAPTVRKQLSPGQSAAPPWVNEVKSR